jgi:hypothetical protein
MPQPMGLLWKSSREMKHLGMCLNCPIPREVASLSDDWSPTWVEGIVDKLPPARAGSGPGLKLFLYLSACRLGSVSGCCYDDIYHPLEKEL